MYKDIEIWVYKLFLGEENKLLKNIELSIKFMSTWRNLLFAPCINDISEARRIKQGEFFYSAIQLQSISIDWCHSSSPFK